MCAPLALGECAVQVARCLQSLHSHALPQILRAITKPALPNLQHDLIMLGIQLCFIYWFEAGHMS